MQTPDQLALTLQRIEEFLAILRLDDFGDDAEGGKRVIDDLRYLHGELRAGRSGRRNRSGAPSQMKPSCAAYTPIYGMP